MKLWLELNLVIAFSFILFSIMRPLLSLSGKYILEQNFFRALPIILLFPFLLNIFPVEAPFSPVVKKQIYNAINSQPPTVHTQEPLVEESALSNKLDLELKDYLFIVSSFAFLFWLVSFFRDMILIQKLVKRSELIKKQGAVYLYLCQDLKVPCSFWWPFKFYVLIPEEVLINKKLYSHTLSHELQHHRQGDTKIIFLLEVFKSIFFVNPFVHLWIKQFNEHRELKCDKEVLLRKGYQANEYGKTLIDVVKINSGIVLNRTWAMASLNKITRRIQMIKTTKLEKSNYPKSLIYISLTMLITWHALAASRGILNLKKMNMQDARSIVSEMQSKIPLNVNTRVLKWINYFSTDPKGKAFLIRSQKRMQTYKKDILAKLVQSNMPVELLAVPFVESGFNNKAYSSSKASGIWQFIPSTARKYGLRVDSKIDDRLDPSKQTDAAISYYSKLLNTKEFKKDWRLALIAYNSGEGRLKKAISSKGTRDPWQFNEVGDKDYLAKVIAGIIVLKQVKSL